MITTNKKLIKNYRDMMAAAVNAKGLIAAEIEKVDAKYAALAEKEKAEFNKQLKALDSQIELCNSFLGDSDADSAEKEMPETKESSVAEPEKIVDTIFPENNEEEIVEEKIVEEKSEESDDLPPFEEVVEDSEEVEDGTNDDIEWEDGSVASAEPESSDSSENEEWPEQPEEW